MRIRRATHADTDGIVEAHDAAVTSFCKLHYTPSEVEDWLWQLRRGNQLSALDKMDCFVAVDDGDVVLGFGFLDVPTAEVQAVYVHPRAAGCGLGKAMLRHLESHARASGCRALTLKASLNAVEFYWSAGYHPTGTAQHLFRSGALARCVGMAKALAPGAEVSPEPPQMPIFLVPHDPLWERRFAQERALVLEKVGDRVLGVEHIGSTSIPGIDAKPLIDILVTVPDIAAAPSFFGPLEELHYEYFPVDERRTPERRWFCKPSPAERTHHLNLVQAGSPWHRGSLAFRDRLRRDAGDRARYEDLKRTLAARFPDDREAYNEGKKAFIAEVIASATR